MRRASRPSRVALHDKVPPKQHSEECYPTVLLPSKRGWGCLPGLKRKIDLPLEPLAGCGSVSCRYLSQWPCGGRGVLRRRRGRPKSGAVVIDVAIHRVEAKLEASVPARHETPREHAASLGALAQFLTQRYLTPPSRVIPYYNIHNNPRRGGGRVTEASSHVRSRASIPLFTPTLTAFQGTSPRRIISLSEHIKRTVSGYQDSSTGGRGSPAATCEVET